MLQQPTKYLFPSFQYNFIIAHASDKTINNSNLSIIHTFTKSIPNHFPLRTVQTVQELKFVKNGNSKDSLYNDVFSKTAKSQSPNRPNTYVIPSIVNTNNFLPNCHDIKKNNAHDNILKQFENGMTISIVKPSQRYSNNDNVNAIDSRATSKLEFVQPEEMKKKLFINLNNNDVNSTFNFDVNTTKRIDELNRPFEEFATEQRKISIEEEREIKKVFQNLFLFDVFPDDVVDIILSSIYIIKVQQNEILIKQDSKNTSFYIVAEGQLESYSCNDPSPEDKPIKIFKAWDYFGQEALIMKNHFENFQYSIKCIHPATLFVLKGEIFLGIKQKLVRLHYDERYDFLNTIIFFKSLDCIVKHSLADKLKIANFKEGELIIKKGDKESAIYLIKSGSVSIYYKGSEMKSMGKSTYVGIISVLMKKKRTLDVYAKENTICFKLTDIDLKDCLGKDYIDVMLMSIFKEYINANSTIAELINEKNLDRVFRQFHLVSYTKNEKINEKNKNLKRVMFVLEGNLINVNTKKIEYSSGAIIGEETLTNNLDISSDLMAFPDCLTLEGNLFDISNYLGEDFRATTLNFLHKVKKIKRNSFFNKISDNSVKRIIDQVKKEKFFAGQKIIEEGTEATKMYIIIKGVVRVSKNGVTIRDLEKDSFFGEVGLLTARKIRTASITAINNVSCFVIFKKEFLSFAQEPGIQKLFKETQSLRNDTIDLGRLKLIKDLGHGKFGNVSLVTNGSSIYAIKAVNRRDANVKKRIAQYLIYERRIMLSLDHPFIVKMEFINGLCMFDLLHSQIKVFNLNETRFYVGSMLLVIDYLQKKQIVYRDLKPNNIMIDTTGYIKLIDFGTAKIIKDYTSTIIGTPHYMAPEVLVGKGYSFSCDYWSLGVVTFEIFFARYPFGAEAKEVMEIYNDIMYSNYRFPFENEMFYPLTDFIDAMLQKRVNKRICSVNKIKNMSLFDFFDWEDLLQMQLTPPYKPEYFNLAKLNLRSFTNSYEEDINSRIDFRMASLRRIDPGNTMWADEF